MGLDKNWRMLAMSKELSIATDLLPHPFSSFQIENSTSPLHMERGEEHSNFLE